MKKSLGNSGITTMGSVTAELIKDSKKLFDTDIVAQLEKVLVDELTEAINDDIMEGMIPGYKKNKIYLKMAAKTRKDRRRKMDRIFRDQS